MEKKTEQIAVWSLRPSDRGKDLPLLTADSGAATLMAKLERDRLDTASCRVVSTAEDVPPAAILEMQQPRLFAQKMLQWLTRLRGLWHGYARSMDYAHLLRWAKNSCSLRTMERLLRLRLVCRTRLP